VTLSDLITALESLSSIKKVIADGRFFETQGEDRNIVNVPYVEVNERDISYTEHSSTARNREVTAEGRVILMKERDNIRTIKAEFEAEFCKYSSDQFHLALGDTLEYSERLYQLPFTVSYFETVAKTS